VAQACHVALVMALAPPCFLDLKMAIYCYILMLENNLEYITVYLYKYKFIYGVG